MSQKNPREILGQIIWHNHLMKFNGKSLDFKHWAKCGIQTIQDVWGDGKVCPNKIKLRLSNVLNLFFELKILRKAIPKRWIEILDHYSNATPSQIEDSSSHHVCDLQVLDRL